MAHKGNCEVLEQSARAQQHSLLLPSPTFKCIFRAIATLGLSGGQWLPCKEVDPSPPTASFHVGVCTAFCGG